jgi:hypothetical protein
MAARREPAGPPDAQRPSSHSNAGRTKLPLPRWPFIVSVFIANRQHGVSHCVSVDVERGQVHVGDGVAGLVIARVVRATSGAAEGGCLGGHLQALGPGEEAAGRDVDPGRDEGAVSDLPVQSLRFGSSPAPGRGSLAAWTP